MEKVKPPVIRVTPGLTRDFVGDLRKQVNAAIAQAQKGLKPILITAKVVPPTKKELAALAAATPAVPVVTVPARGPAAAPAAAAAAARTKTPKRDDVDPIAARVRARKLLNEVEKIGLGIESKAALKTTEASKARARLNEELKISSRLTSALESIEGVRDKRLRDRITKLKEASEERQRGLRVAIRQAEVAPPPAVARAAARAPKITPEQKAIDRAVSGLNTLDREEKELLKTYEKLTPATKDLAKQTDLLHARRQLATQAERAHKAALLTTSDALKRATLDAQTRTRAAVNESEQIVKGLREEEKAAKRQASSEKRRSEQLSRGGQASILSLAGIRGATLAASRSFLAGAAAVTVFANAVRQFADLERNIHVFEATTSATEQQMEAVREQARLLGADLTLPAVTAGDAAGAMVELAKAGLSVEDSIDAARSVLELATAAAIDNADSVRLVANVLNAFSLAGTEAADVADTLANAANAAQGSIADIGTAFQQAASAGRQVGLSFQDTAVFLTILAKNGIRGSDAGTSLRTALIRLINPSDKAKEAFKKLGISIHDAAGNLRPDVFLQIAAATKEMAPAQRDATIALIGGQDAFRAVTILGRQTVESFLEMRRALREEGTAAELAAARTKGLHGSIDALQSILETVGTTMASHVGPGIAGFVYQLGQGITAMSESETVANSLESTLEAVAGAFNLLGQAIKAVSVVALPLADVLLRLTNAFGVPAILGGIIAYKAFAGTLERTTKAVTKARAAWAALGTVEAATAGTTAAGAATTASGLIVVEDFTKAQTKAVGSTAKLKAALTAAAGSFNLYVLAAAAATAGIVFLATRESATERATRKLKEATDDLISSLTERNRLTRESRDAPLQVNAARLGVIEAEQAASRARGALAQSDAAKGTFARTKLELQLAVALDNVEIAQNAYTDAVERANIVERQRQQAVATAQEKRAEEIRSINDLIDASEKRARALKEAGSPEEQQTSARITASKLISAGLQTEIDKARELNTAESLAFANRLVLLQKTSDAIKGLPDGAVDIVLNAPDLKTAGRQLQEALRRMGEDGSNTLLQSILLGLGVLPKALKDYIDGPTRDVFRQAAANVGTDAGNTMGQNFMAAFAAAIKRSAGRRAGLSIQEDLAVIASGATGATLPVLQEQLAQARADRARAEAQIATLQAKGQTKGLATAREERARAIAEERRIIEEIRSINDQLASDAKSAANEAKSKQDQIFQDVLEAMGLRRDRLQERIEAAQLTEGLADDIARTRVLRRVVKQQIDNLVARIAAARKQGQNVKILIQGLRELRFLWRELGRTIRETEAERQEALREQLFQRFELRIRIAQANENVAAEIKIRRQKIAALTKEIDRLKDAGKKNTIAWLELVAQRAEEEAAIRELTKQQKEVNNATAEAQFQFLQMQSGFAANLLGNLIPGGATSGLVGGTGFGGNIGSSGSTPVGSLDEGGLTSGGIPGPHPSPFEHGRGQGGKATVQPPISTGVQGPTKTQAARTNHLLGQMLVLLQDIKRGQGHPEAKTRRTQSQNEFAQSGNV